MFTDSERARVAAAIAAAEGKTAGEIVVIVSDTAERHAATALTVAALAAFVLPLAGVLFGWNPADIGFLRGWGLASRDAEVRLALEIFAAVQIAVFAAVAALLWFSGGAAALTPRAIKRDRVHAAAMVQFKARGFAATAGRTGVLLYVSMPDHVAEVIADTGIYAVVDPEHWGATIAALIAELRAGRPADGLAAAVGLIGAVLAEHFPPAAANPNELPDHLIEI